MTNGKLLGSRGDFLELTAIFAFFFFSFFVTFFFSSTSLCVGLVEIAMRSLDVQAPWFLSKKRSTVLAASRVEAGLRSPPPPRPGVSFGGT